MAPKTQPKTVYLVVAEINSLSTEHPHRLLIEQKLEVESGKEAYDWLTAQAQNVKGWIIKAKVSPVDSETGEVMRLPAPAPVVEKPCPLKDLTAIVLPFPNIIGIGAPNTCEEKEP